MEAQAQILIADDEPYIRTLLTDILRHDGHVCTCVDSGSAALAALEDGDYDVLLTDIVMPGNTDLDLVKQVRARHEGLPVILMTGYPSVDTAAAGLQMPVTAYLTKPINHEELSNQVRSAVRQRRLARALARTKARCLELVGELDAVQTALAESPRQSQHAIPSTYLALLLENLLGNFKDLEGVKDAGAPHVARPADTESIGGQRELILETLRVLEKTKTAFKSRDLGELRRKIEAFLKEKG